MSFTFVIPFGGEYDEAREQALEVVRTKLAADHSHAILWGGDAGERLWSKGNVMHRLVQRTQTEGLILHDADVLVAPTALRRAMLAVSSGAHPWAMPHRTVYRLSRRATMRIGHVNLDDLGPVPAAMLERPPHPAPHGGGIVVLSRDAYDLVGGIDPRFYGWGGEDISFARALDTLAGLGHRGDAPLWHLWHPRQDRRRGNRASPASERLASRYLDAFGNPVAMAGVVAR